MNNNIQLCDIDSCTQCHACEQVCPKGCIQFVEGEGGFRLPKINQEDCIECGACMRSCHQLNEPSRERLQMPMSYASWSEDISIRRHSSSGGVFSELAHVVFLNDGIVVGTVMTNDLQVRHSFAETGEQLSFMRGSKYVQSDLVGIYSQVKHYLQEDKMVLFTGTPCQVAGLYAFLGKDYQNLLTCDLVCHGVPSQKSFDIYCKKIGIKNAAISEVGFRYTRGWGLRMAMRKGTLVSHESRKTEWKSLSPKKSYYLKAFTGGLMFSEACYHCHYARTERMGDITLADYWGIGTKLSFKYPTKRGVSLVLVNTKRGMELLDKCDHLFKEERPLSEAIEGNHNLSKCSERPAGRDTFIEDSEVLGIEELLRKYNISPTWKDYLRPIKRFLMR